MTLDIGPGRNVQPHESQPVVRVDSRVDAKPDVVADVRALPFRAGVFDVVYSSHVLEHFHQSLTVSILKEWLRVLRAGGEFQLAVPNLEWCMLQLQAGIFDDFVMNALYGRQEYPNDVHRTGFTVNRLVNVLAATGVLNGTNIKTFRNSICVWATKPSLLS